MDRPIPPVLAANMADINRAARIGRDAVPPVLALARTLRGQGGKRDMVHALAHVIVAGRGGSVESACLAGSFAPAVASRLSMVG